MTSDFIHKYPETWYKWHIWDDNHAIQIDPHRETIINKIIHYLSK
jgi:hypothetical protein